MLDGNFLGEFEVELVDEGVVFVVLWDDLVGEVCQFWIGVEVIEKCFGLFGIVLVDCWVGVIGWYVEEVV